MSQVSYGTITITDTTDIERIYTVYAKSANNTTVPSIEVSTWSETVSTAPGTGNYIWQRTVVEKSGTGDKTYSDPVCLTGEEGTDATEISGIEVRYGISADWNTQPSSWSVDTPVYDSSKPKYWTRTRLIYDTNPVTYSDPVYTKDEALTKAVTDAAVANSIAQHANEDAQGAMSQAAAAQQQVTQIDTLLGGHFLWHGSAPSQNTKAGARVVEQVTEGGIDVSANPAKWLHNVNIGANGIQLRYNEAVMAQLAATNPDSSNDIALKFYQPPTISGDTTTQGNLTMALKGNALTFYDPTVANGQSVQATLDANGLILKKGGIESGDLSSGNGYVYLSTEDKAGIEINGHLPGNEDPKWRQIIGSKFGVDSEGNLYASNAVINGQITVGSGSNVYTITEANTIFDTKESAEQVRQSAESAARSANSALTQLGVVEEVVNTINWLAEHGDYSITEDTVAQSDKLYYKRIYIYTKTTDTSIDSTKTYYTQSGTGTDADPYVYTEVENPVVADIENYYEATVSYSIYDVPEDGNPHELGLYQLDGVDEAVTNYIASHIALTDNGLWITADDSGYRILISSDGIRLYSPEGVISTFGENIEFNSSNSQRIGGENEYIEFDHTTGKLNIVADSVSIGSRDASTAFESIENTLTPIQDQLDSHDETLQNQQSTLNNLTGYVDINTEDSYIRVGKRDADSYVQIDGADTKVAININGKDVAYMNGNRFYAPSAVVTNLYMKTEDNTIGTIGWVMRSNGHLSLKRLR